MRKAQTVRLVALKPRNSVFRAMRALGKRTTKHEATRRQSDRNRTDLAQRVRELGEW